MTVLAAKNYQMIPCPKCKGVGTGKGWICTNCDGRGKVSIYPPRYVLRFSASARNENGWTP